jgi:hypothetical protein
MGWDNARAYFYQALTATGAVDRESNFVKTFRSVGQVLHLLEDMAVPAHVRNDFKSHLSFNGVNSMNPTKWFGNPFEYYVQVNPGLIARITPEIIASEIPVFEGGRLTDFWDTNQNGSIPGLAEFTNANYFSDETIPNNKPSAEHAFPLPQINVDHANQFICVDNLAGSSRPTKYVSRKACPQNGEAVDHFAALSLINSEAEASISNPQIKEVWLDNNVHETYANEILPKAVGYSAAILDYFFRGKINVSSTPDDISFRSVKIMAQNDTPGENLGTGEATLVIRYKPLAETALRGNKYLLGYPTEGTSPSDYIYKVSNPQNIDLSNPVELTFDFSNDPLPHFFSDMTMQLVFKGQLGNEAGSVAVSKLEPIEGIATDFHISLPSTGVYAKTTTTENAFPELRVAVTTDIPGGLSLPGGKFELALEYREAKSFPFQSEPVETEPEDGAAYLIRIPEANGVAALPQGTPVELVFDLSSVPLPYNATHVELNVIYSGASAEGAPVISAVGYRDISEPTPVDLFNNTDKVCIKGNWYVSGSPEALAAVDDNGNSLADESDIFPHELTDIYYRGSSTQGTVVTASPTTYNLSGGSALSAGAYRRLGYILTDYSFRYNISDLWRAMSPEDEDLWVHLPDNDTYLGAAVRNDDSTYPSMYGMRGIKMWGGAGVIYDNHNYPEEPDCPWEAIE